MHTILNIGTLASMSQHSTMISVYLFIVYSDFSPFNAQFLIPFLFYQMPLLMF